MDIFCKNKRSETRASGVKGSPIPSIIHPIGLYSHAMCYFPTAGANQFNNFELNNGHWNNNWNFQPVLPISLTKDWNLITRPVMPFYNRPT